MYFFFVFIYICIIMVNCLLLVYIALHDVVEEVQWVEGFRRALSPLAASAMFT